MKTQIAGLVLVILCLTAAVGLGADSSAEADARAIEATVRDYIEGWFASDPARMEKALHPNLLKATVRTLPQTDTEYLDIIEAEGLVAYAGHNQAYVQNKSLETLKIVYQDDRIAVVHAVSTDFIDVCGLVKLNGEWTILQVLWSMR
jgi:hypothetical protein